MSKNAKGFSLIELLIVIVIIGIIAAIAAPNLLAARRSANESSAISSLRTLHGAQAIYQTSIGAGNYAGTVSANGDAIGLATLQTVGLIDEVLGSGIKSNYTFVGARTLSTNANPATFFFSTNPVSDSGVTQSGTKRFCITQLGFIGFDIYNLSTPFDQNSASQAEAINN